MKKIGFGLMAALFLVLAACGKKQPRPAMDLNNPFVGAWLAPLSTCNNRGNGTSSSEAYYIYNDSTIQNVTEYFEDEYCMEFSIESVNWEAKYTKVSDKAIQVNYGGSQRTLELINNNAALKDNLSTLVYTKFILN